MHWINPNSCFQVHVFDTQFYFSLIKHGYGKERTTKAILYPRKLKLFSKKCLVVPINILDKHWVLALVSPSSGEISYFDPMATHDEDNGNTNCFTQPHCLDVLIRYLSYEWARVNPGKEPIKWTITLQKDIPPQTNGFACGVFLCAFGVCSANSVPLTRNSFTQDQLPMFREQIALSICTGRPVVLHEANQLGVLGHEEMEVSYNRKSTVS